MAKKKTAKKKTAKLVATKKTAKKKTANQIQLADQIWPIERDVFFRPARLKYVRKIVKPDGCVFCNTAINPASLETLCVFKTKHSHIVLNKYPYNSGHILVLPLRHIGNILELTELEYSDLYKTLKLAMKAVQNIYEPNGFNVGMNHGATAGAGIPAHLHFHIIPRWNGDLNFFPLIAETKLVVETAEQSYQRFSEYFANLKEHE